MLLFELCHLELCKKIYKLLPVIFFTERACGLDFPPAPLPPFLFSYMPPLFLFFGFYFVAFFGFVPYKKESIFSFLGTSKIYILSFCPANV